MSNQMGSGPGEKRNTNRRSVRSKNVKGGKEKKRKMQEKKKKKKIQNRQHRGTAEIPRKRIKKRKKQQDNPASWRGDRKKEKEQGMKNKWG